jgi:hypothetical protein
LANAGFRRRGRREVFLKLSPDEAVFLAAPGRLVKNIRVNGFIFRRFSAAESWKACDAFFSRSNRMDFPNFVFPE